MGKYTNQRKYKYNKGYSRTTISIFEFSKTYSRNSSRMIGFLIFVIVLSFFSSGCGKEDDNKTDYNQTQNRTTEEQTTELGLSAKEMAIDTFVMAYSNSDCVYPFDQETIRTIENAVREKKCYSKYNYTFENKVNMRISGSYESGHYFVLQLQYENMNDDELIIVLKDCIDVIYPNITDEDMNKIVEGMKENGYRGYDYNDEFHISYDCIELINENIYNILITYK